MTARAAPSTVIGVAPSLSVTNTSSWYVPSSGIAEPVMEGAVTVYCAALPFWVMPADARDQGHKAAGTDDVNRRRVVGDRPGAAGVDERGDGLRRDGQAFGPDDREGRDGECALGHVRARWGREDRRAGGRAKRDRDGDTGDGRAVGVRERPTQEPDRVGHGVGPVLGIRVRAINVVDTGVARVLGIQPAVLSGDGSPQSIVAVKSLAGRLPGVMVGSGTEGGVGMMLIGAEAVKVPVIALTFWKPSIVLIVRGRPGVMTAVPALTMLTIW